MNLKHLLAPLTLTLGFSLLTPAIAQVTTDPVGYKTLTIKGGNNLSIIGLEFLNASDFTGTASSVTSNTVTSEGVNFDDLLDANKTYFLDLISGSDAGANTLILSWSGDTLTLGDDLTSAIVTDTDQFRLHSLPTIGDIFGIGGDVIVGGSATTADLILLPNPAGTGLIRIYYSTGGFTGIGWRQVGSSGDKSNLPIYFTDGLYVLKKSAGDSQIVVSGSVKVTPTKVIIEDGYLPYSTIFPSATTLFNSGLYDSNNLASSITAGSATTADLVFTDTDGDGILERYYYSSGGFSGTGWRQVGASGDKSDVTLSSSFAVFNQNGPVLVSRQPAY